MGRPPRPPQVTEVAEATDVRDVRVSFLLAMDGKADKDDFRPNKVACSSFAIRCFLDRCCHVWSGRVDVVGKARRARAMRCSRTLAGLRYNGPPVAIARHESRSQNGCSLRCAP